MANPVAETDYSRYLREKEAEVEKRATRLESAAAGKVILAAVVEASAEAREIRLASQEIRFGVATAVPADVPSDVSVEAAGEAMMKSQQAITSGIEWAKNKRAADAAVEKLPFKLYRDDSYVPESLRR